MAKIKVQNTEITIININDKDYISLTDMVRDIENGLALIEKWLRNKNTIEFLGIWESMYNPGFNSLEFGGIKNAAGLNRFILSVKQWVERAHSLGMTTKQWREANPELKGNIRDYATINELICLSNMENVFDKRVQSKACLRFAERRKCRTKFNINAVLINDGLPQGERLVKLNQIAIQQMKVLNDNEGRKLLK